jgi:hypothetical protein
LAKLTNVDFLSFNKKKATYQLHENQRDHFVTNKKMIFAKLCTREANENMNEIIGYCRKKLNYFREHFLYNRKS